MTENVIEVNGLSKHYQVYPSSIDRIKEAFSLTKKKYHQTFEVLKDISFEVQEGETIGILGENGAGKSTLLKIITGVLQPTTGQVKLKGKVASLLELGAGFNPELTGIENVYFHGTLMGLTTQEIDQRIERIVEFADIGEYIRQPVKNYSSGMFARLAFASSIHVDPEVLIVDEALSVGDVFFQQKCFAFMKDEFKSVTKVLVSHDIATLTHMCDRILVLREGKLTFFGEPKKAVQHYQEEKHKTSYLEQNTVDQIPNQKLSLNNRDQPYSDFVMNYIGEESITGIQDLRINRFVVLVNGNPGEIVNPGDNIEVVFEVCKSAEIHGDMVLGFHFQDRMGQIIFGQNTLEQSSKSVVFKNDIVIVKFSFEWPQIKRGEYTLTIGLGEVDPVNELKHNIQCWANNIAKIYSERGYKHDALVSVEFAEITIQDEKVL